MAWTKAEVLRETDLLILELEPEQTPDAFEWLADETLRDADASEDGVNWAREVAAELRRRAQGMREGGASVPEGVQADEETDRAGRGPDGPRRP